MQPAREAFQSVLALDPNHPRALLGLARIAIEGGDPDAARPALERALLYHPDFPEARVLEKMLAVRTAVQRAISRAHSPGRSGPELSDSRGTAAIRSWRDWTGP